MKLLRVIPFFITTTANIDGYRVPVYPCGHFSEYMGYRVIGNKFYINCLKNGAITVRIYK